MTVPDLGRLEKVDLRRVWANEAVGFTPWLATAENLALLGDAIGIDLELEAQEKNVGPFRADILCKDTDTGHWVLIENQLERTDHIHLGQLMTYAAGLQAVTIVWVAAEFTEEHRAALDWLNEITSERFRFFGVEIELWRIGNSPAAPKFNIVSKPNDWTKAVGQAARRIESEALTNTKLQQLEFWSEFHDYLAACRSPIRPQKPYPQHWMNFGIGRTGFLLGALLHSPESWIGVELYLNDEDAKTYFRLLKAQKDAIEQELGFELIWLELPERKGCRILHRLTEVKPLDQDRWPEYREWMRRHLEKFNAVFRPRIRTLDASTSTLLSRDTEAAA